MLNPRNNRLDYGSILSSPSNYEVDFAIGTTYSLDLDALVGASISLGLSQENDSDLTDNAIFLLEALRSTGDKIALFCQSGQIHLPTKVTPLYILLEDMVFQVTRYNSAKTSSFHPKFWLLRYINENNDVLYRVIVLSRNLTFDRSWDISFTMDGYKQDKKTDKTTPLINFIDYLIDFTTSKDKINKMNEIKDELPYIHFDLDSNTFNDFHFIINGIGDEQQIQDYPLFKDNSIDSLFIMSPFLTSSVIDDFNNRKNDKSKAILITQSMSLGKLNPQNSSNFEVYTLKDEIVDGESLISDESQNIFKQDIHAKIFAVEKRKFTNLYLGSFNATENALYNNVEFMIKLHSRKNKLPINKLVKEIFNGEKEGPDSPFKLIEITKTIVEPDGENSLDRFIKMITRLNPKATIIPNDNTYDIELKLDNYDSNEFKDVNIKINSLLSNKKCDLSKRMVFEKLDKIQLSEFFVVCVSNEEKTVKRVLKVPTKNMPLDRQEDVVSSVVNDETAFIRYVAFLLGDDYIISSIESGADVKGSIGRSLNIQLPELYEKMLKAAVYAPEKFHELEFLIKTLSKDNVVPEGFEELYNTFKRVID